MEKLAGFGRRLDSCHELSERDDLLVDLKDPALDVGVVVVGHVLHSEHLAVLLGLGLLRPGGGIGLKIRVCMFTSKMKLK